MKEKQTRCQVTMKNSLTCGAKGLRTTLLQHRGVQSFFQRMTFLILLFVGFCGNAWGQTNIPTQYFKTLDEVGDNSFAIINRADGTAFYSSNEGNGLGIAELSTAFNATNHGCVFKFVHPDGFDANEYLLQLYNTDGTAANIYGGAAYLNSQSTDEGKWCSFLQGLGSNDQYGQDGQNLAVWIIEEESVAGTFKLKNKGTNKYLNNTQPAKFDTGIDWSFCKLGAGLTVNWDTSKVPTGCDAWFVINGNEYRATQNNVPAGSDVAYHATATDDHRMLYAWRYANNDVAQWNNYDYTIANINEDINISPWFGSCYYIKTEKRGDGSGAAKVYVKTDGGKTDISNQKRKEIDGIPSVVFEAQAAAGSEFKGWWDGEKYVSTVATYEPTITSKTDFILYAIFEPLPGHTVTFTSINNEWGTVTATVDGNPITSGDKVAEGKEVTFTATKAGSNLFWRWNITGESKPDYDNNPKKVTITADYTIEAEFSQGIHVRAYTNNAELGTVNIKRNENYGTDWHVTPWPGAFTFIATPVGDNKFEGWYTNSSHTGDPVSTELSYQKTDLTNSDYTLYAKFTKTINITDKPECGTGHYFNQKKMNAGSGVTLSVDDDGHGTVTVGSGGGYVSFNFAEGYNFTEIYKWEIGSDNKSNVNYVAFLKNGSVINMTLDGAQQPMQFYTGATNRTLEDKYKPGLADVDEIRIGFKPNTTTTVNYFTLEIKPEVMYKVPTLAAPTTTEMVIYDTETLNLRITDTNGYWREYTDNTYTNEITTRIHKTNDEYSPSYDLSGLTVGHYYFQIKHGGNCKLSHYHTTDPVNVHVEVKATPTNLRITYNLNATSGNPVVGEAPVDNTSYNYKQSATIMAPGSISREGYFFGYWSLNPDGSGTRYSHDSDLGETHINVTGDITLYAIWNKEGFEGYFNFENRLIAQWNIDLADGARLHEPSMAGDTWEKEGPTTHEGKTKTTYTLKSAINFGELVYGGTHSTVKIPVFAGLKFKANANEVKIVVTKKGDEIMNTQLVLAEGVQLQLPYVRNSYRDDSGNDQSPYGWQDKFIAKGTTWGGKTYDKDTWGVVYHDEFRPDNFSRMQDCIHHINRDIVYIVCSPTVWVHSGKESGAITNKCYDDSEKVLFNNGGDEDVHGLRNGEKKVWEKLNFCGNQGTPCIITFAKETTIDRIGVNRNLTYSYYTENIAATSNGQYVKPIPGLRIIGSPRGAKVADVGGTYATYSDAIAMTYGGWPYNSNEYKDGDNTTITDTWGNMTVYYGDQTGITEGNDSYDSSQFTSIDVTKVPVATDGFPVYSREASHAYSESVNPTEKSDDGGTIVYHDKNYGNFLQHQDDGGSSSTPYLANYNPWTLPCRGAYVKFEPTLPGVLNVHILQEASPAIYYIADEFGRLVKENVFVKAGTTSTTVTNNNGHFSINKKDNVKYSFDVYPGKTYYLFSNTAGMGVTGFYFEPYVYRKYHQLSDAPTSRTVNGHTVNLDQNEEYELARQDVGLKTATMTAGPVFTFSDATYDYTNQTAAYPGGTQKNLNEDTGAQITKDDGTGNQVPDVETYSAISKTAAGSYPNQSNNVNPLVYDNKAVHVTLDRSFTAGKWSTIVLPYSMNNLQLDSVFGKGTKVVLLRDVQHYDPAQGGKTTAYFVYHMNQDIIAGYPYLILPTKTISKVETNAYIYNTATDNTFNSALSGYTAPSIVEISGVGPNLVTYKGHTYGGMSEYTFKASYTNTETIPAGSYVMSNNKLTKVPNNQTAGAFRGYLHYSGPSDSAAKGFEITAVSFGGKNGEFETDPSAIEDILLDQGITTGTPNVYGIDGQLVRKNADNLYGLKKGIYIVNGKKYTVK